MYITKENERMIGASLSLVSEGKMEVERWKKKKKTRGVN